ncbi:MAG: CotH kinase family protein [Candidatus Nealsonbacteria bacterium]|nr:CotH kinase family protein [Candidatus Nealsonbacteria bacterium]
MSNTLRRTLVAGKMLLGRRKATAKPHTPPARLLFEALEPRLQLSGFTAFNDTIAGGATHANTTTYADVGGGSSSGQLKDIDTGALTPVLLSTFGFGVHPGGTGSSPASGTDAADIFSGYVDFSSATGNSLEIESGDSYTYDFSNLDPGNTYEFAGTAVRGDSSYTNRWTRITLLGADAATADHSSGAGVITTDLPSNQVVLWTGDNSQSDQGWVVQWTDIDPGDDGQFEVVSEQYIYAGSGSKGYGLNGIRLIEHEPSAPPVIVNRLPANIEAFAAELGGSILSTGGEAPNVTLYYGEGNGGTDPNAWDHAVDLGERTGVFTTVVGGLSQNTVYYCRIFAENSVGPAWAPTTRAFATLEATAPAVANRPAINVGAFSAWLGGEVLDTGNDSPLVTVYYGKTDGGTDGSAWDDSIVLGARSAEFTVAVDKLDPLTTYYFSAFAQNAVSGVWAAPALSLTTTDAPPLQITEFMADNGTALTTRTRQSTGDPFVGDYDTPDWIEIHNPVDATVVLDGFHLSDDLDDLTKWTFPSGTSIEPGGYLVVFASGDNITDTDLDERGYLHADFKLKDGGGEDVVLSDAAGEVLYSYESYPVQTENTSYGVDALGVQRFYPMSTPGWDNANEIPRAPQFSVASTTFTGSIQVVLTKAYPTDVIHYTLNETAPTASSPVYTGLLSISNTTMLRAVSVGTNGKLSHVVSESYIELGADMLDDNTNLPIVIVDTFGDGVPGTGTYFGDVFIAIIEPGEDGRARLTDSFTSSTRGGIHIRGSSSAHSTKKQYRVEFRDESDQDRGFEVLGMPAEADWIFYGPGQYDRALITNPLMYDLSNQIGQYAVRTRWVEMYLNSSGGQLSGSNVDYYGTYAVMEVIERGDDRVDVERLSTGAGGVPVSGGFIWKKDKTGMYVDPQVPTSAQRSYIDGYINTVNNAAIGQHGNWADLDSFVDHNLLNMLAMNVDAFRISAYNYKTADGLLVAGPVWDFDRALDSTDGRDDNEYRWYGTGDSSRPFDHPSESWPSSSSRVMHWWPNMFKDPDMVQRYIDRWFDLREDEFSLTNLMGTIDAHATELAEAAPRDYARWYTPRYGGFTGEINNMKGWLTNRVNWVDSQWLPRPTLNVSDGVVAPGTQVSLSGSTGSVYYTLDGTDPRAPGGGIAAGAIRATGPITVNAYQKVTARIYKSGHTPPSGTPGYVPPGYVSTGDDWSAPAVSEYFTNPLAGPGDLAIAEINYHPHDATAAELAGQPPADPDFEGNDFEFIEVRNVSGHTLNVGGVYFTGGVKFTLEAQVLTNGQRIVIAEDLEGFAARYGAGLTVSGPYNGELDNGGEQLTMLARNGSTLLDFAYNDASSWPGRADGKGASLVLTDPSVIPGADPQRTDFLQDGGNWHSSVKYGGTPAVSPESAVGIVINEVLSHTDWPDYDSIELHNVTGAMIDVGGWYLSDSWGWESNLQNGNYGPSHKKCPIGVDGR